MGLNVNLSHRHLVVPVLLAMAPCVHAQLVDDVDLRREGADAVLQVRFVTPVQYRRALVPRSSDTAQVFYDVVAARTLPALAPSERRIAGGGAMPDITLGDESAGRGDLSRRLVLRLSRAAPLQVRAGRGDRSIEIVLTGLGTAIPASVDTGTPGMPASGFQITLQQSDDPNLQIDTPIPAALQRYPVYTGKRTVNGRLVYEVNIGPFATLVEAEAARQQLQRRFPQASIALPPPPAPAPAPAAAAPVAAAPIATPPPPTLATPAEVDARAAALLAAAQAADAQQDHATALARLNELLNLPINPSTREAHALIGQVRERLGDTVRARAEYQTFLQLYPSGPDADRVRAALARLPAPVVAAGPKPRPAAEPTSTLTGSLSAFYYGGASKIRTQEFQDSPISGLPELVGDNTLSGTDQKQLLGNVDVNWRYRDVDTDMRFVFRDAYTADQLNSDKSRNRLSALYVEHRSLSLGTSVRLGRQSATGGGVLGRFDGAQVGYTFVPKWRVNAVVGVPTDKLLESRRRFYGTWIDADALAPNLGASLYTIRQVIDGEIDRNAVGTELRYFSPSVSATGIVDYDTSIRGVNIASLQGTWQLEEASVVNFLYDRRKTPMLMMGNALFFQDPALALLPSLRALLDTGLSIDELRARVRSTTSDTTQALLGATTPINKTWQVGADVRLTDVGEVLPVAVILPSGQGRSRNVAIGGQLIGTNLYSQRDTHVLSATVLQGTNYSLTDPVTVSRYAGGLLSYNNSSQVNETLLLEPSLKLYRQGQTGGVRTTRWTPGLRLTYRVLKQVAIESELSAEYSRTTGPGLDETSHRTYYYVGGRYDF
jgi:tetratricopeptide (TPR) repeat protein